MSEQGQGHVHDAVENGVERIERGSDVDFDGLDRLVLRGYMQRRRLGHGKEEERREKIGRISNLYVRQVSRGSVLVRTGFIVIIIDDISHLSPGTVDNPIMPIKWRGMSKEHFQPGLRREFIRSTKKT